MMDKTQLNIGKQRLAQLDQTLKNFYLGSLTVPKQMAMNEQTIKKTSILHLHSTVKL